jgi:hypothetical protein
VRSRSTNTMVNTIDRASVDEDSTSSSLAIRGLTFPPPIVGMMIREQVPPTIVPAMKLGSFVGDYVTGTGATRGVPAAGGRSRYLSSQVRG